MTQVAILWHMHQPYYEDLVTHEHILPWVRLHALKDYFGMVAILREFPNVRMTFNLVPSLLVQLEAFAEDRARDRFLELSLKPAEALTDGEAAFIIENFFHAQRQRMIDIYPRYAELLARRGGSLPTGGDVRSAARRFSRDDLRDLQVWHKLAWLDPSYLERDVRARTLVDKGRGFTETDKTLLREIELELLNRVIPEYRAAAERGQVELSTSPFYHPILPLLCDTDVYRRTHPNSPMPRHRFVHPEDASRQLTDSVALHRRLFGHAPVGVWPSEGSVSDAVIPLAAAAGFKWLATDELILARSLGLTLSRTGDGYLDHPERLYSAYDVKVGGARIAAAFRDHMLSDLIGFTYAGWAADAAADDFVRRLSESGRRYTLRTGEEALVSVILDGENAWEHFEGGGRPFLRALYGRLSNHPDLRTVTMAEGCRQPRRELTSIFPGSWIDANFYIWIGHRDDQRAWSQLAEARAALDRASGIEPEHFARARQEVLIAEGSDWFWWYGDDHSSAHDQEFDDLFRRHLCNAYRLLQRPIPDELFASNISTGPAAPVETASTTYLTPTLDGEETSYFEWLGAGTIEVRQVVGAMHRVSAAPGLLTLVRFGFDREHLYLRFDSSRPAADVLADGFELALKFERPEGLRFSIRRTDGRVTGRFWARRDTDRRWVERGPGGARVAAGTIVEAALPLADLGIGPAAVFAFFVAVYDSANQEVERHPASRPVELAVPDDRFEARNWIA